MGVHVSSVVIVVVSLFTKPRPVAELDGLVYGATKLPKEEPVPFYKNEWFWASIAIVIFLGLNIYLLVRRFIAAQQASVKRTGRKKQCMVPEFQSGFSSGFC